MQSDNEDSTMPDQSPSSSSSAPSTPLRTNPSPPSSQLSHPHGLAPPPPFSTHPNLQQNPSLQQHLADPTPPGSANTTPMNHHKTLSGGAASSLGLGQTLGGKEEAGQPGKPGWMTKRAQEEAEHAMEKLLDKGFTLKWAGDVADESAMFS